MFGRNDPEVKEAKTPEDADAPENAETPEKSATPDDRETPEEAPSPEQLASEIRAQFVSPLRPAETSNVAPDRAPLDTPEPAPSPASSEPPVFPEAIQPRTVSDVEEPRAPLGNADSTPTPAPAPSPDPADCHTGHVLVGEGVKIVGQIRECRKIEIFGTVDGDLEVEELIVRENGMLKGNVKADRAEVWGALDGEVNVKELLDVKAGGSVSGKTEYGALAIANGGRVIGTLDDGSNKLTKPASVSTFTPSTVTDRLTTEA